MGFGFDTFSLVNCYVNLVFSNNFYANLVLLNITLRFRVMFLTSQIFLFYCFCVVFQTMEILLFFCSILILLPALSLQYELLPFEEAWEDWTPKEYRGCLWAVGLMCLLFQSLSLSLSFCLQFFFFFFYCDKQNFIFKCKCRESNFERNLPSFKFSRFTPSFIKQILTKPLLYASHLDFTCKLYL